MKKLIVACLIATSTAEAHAVCTGPGVEATATTVQQLRDAGREDQRIALRGHIVKSIGEKYQFADSTGELPVKIDHKHWPAEEPVNQTGTIELAGKYDKEIVGASKAKVYDIKVVQ
ncbi:NirD/YgiW/YdeI family stress tolerance protein [Paraburkholderia youngii]|uniref:NirD/YgiW/YdeI family stress tolerance protein n=1 Tax=Paraburkholderia youngii TaxID=2782701 RepID=A0A7Y6JZ71_9BURK|nr:NirD/YgiW/YdeI family stress tolerance protein [Paraburkholderia youngii]NUY00906.1 NirD/YgiW/YdeI family stress tolerance protein [Paraburkholderia youngii]